MTDVAIFEPGELTPFDLAAMANREHALALQSGVSMMDHARLAGEALLQAKATQAHGDWLPWLAANFNASDRTANGYMSIARNPQRVADLQEPSLRKAIEAISKGNGRGERDHALTERRVDLSVIDEAIHLLDAFNKMASKITPELLGRLSQSVCKRYEYRASVAETHLANQRAELRPRLDSLTPTRRG